MAVLKLSDGEKVHTQDLWFCTARPSEAPATGEFRGCSPAPRHPHSWLKAAGLGRCPCQQEARLSLTQREEGEAPRCPTGASRAQLFACQGKTSGQSNSTGCLLLKEQAGRRWGTWIAGTGRTAPSGPSPSCTQLREPAASAAPTNWYIPFCR